MKRSLLAALLLLAGCTSNMVSGSETAMVTISQDGWYSLFDGRSLTGWTNRGTADWHVDNGEITVTPGTGQGHLATNQTFADFRLQLDFLAGDGANSGVYVRAPAEEPATVDNSFEVQIFDAGPEWQTGAVIQVQGLTEKPNTVGRWTNLDISVVGFHFRVLLDGKTVVDADGPPRLSEGVIILSPAQGELRFRNIRIQPLSCFACAHPSTYE